MLLKNQVGLKAGPYNDRLNENRIAAFAQAVGAKASGETPPTFMTICRKGEFELFQKLQIPLSRVLHAEQEYLYENDIWPADLLIYETKLASVVDKQSGKGTIHFLVFESQIGADRGGEKLRIGTSKTTIAVRA